MKSSILTGYDQKKKKNVDFTLNNISSHYRVLGLRVNGPDSYFVSILMALIRLIRLIHRNLLRLFKKYKDVIVCYSPQNSKTVNLFCKTVVATQWGEEVVGGWVFSPRDIGQYLEVFLVIVVTSYWKLEDRD